MGYQGVGGPLFRGCSGVAVCKLCRLTRLRVYVADPRFYWNQLRIQRHPVQLFIKKEILHSDEEYVVIGKLLPGKLAGFQDGKVSLAQAKQSAEQEGNVHFSIGCVVSAGLDVGSL